ncbi:MAG: hypothetical protein R3F60_27385 [bacterium]
MDAAQRLLNRLLDFAPTLALLIGVILVGAALSKALVRGVRWLVDQLGIEALAERLGISRLLYGLGIQAGFGTVAGRLAGWLGFLITLLVASEIAGLGGVTDAIMRLLMFLPRALTAGLVLLAGLRIAEVMRGLVRRAGASSGRLESPEAVASLAYHAVIVLTFTLAAAQLGLETTLINNLIQVVVAAAAFGAALAMALGARRPLAGVVARYYTAQLFRPGDRVRLAGDVEGTLLRYGAASAFLTTDDGRELVVPCRQLLEGVVELRREGRPVRPPTGPDPAA